jgi:hypothetical protein
VAVTCTAIGTAVRTAIVAVTCTAIGTAVRTAIVAVASAAIGTAVRTAVMAVAPGRATVSRTLGTTVSGRGDVVVVQSHENLQENR